MSHVHTTKSPPGKVLLMAQGLRSSATICFRCVADDIS